MNPSRRRFLTRVPLAVGAVLLAPPGAARSDQATAVAPRSIAIAAHRFSFSPNRIELKLGEPVILEVTALDFAHGFNISDMQVRADLIPGKPVPISLTPDKPGRFSFLCDNFCGSGHEQMEGVIFVLP